MSGPVTEVASFHMKAGVDIDDAENQGYQTWQDTLKMVSAQPGFQSAYYGKSMEDQTLVQLFIGWDSLEAHKTFIKSPPYQPFVDALLAILDGPPILYHYSPQTPKSNPPSFLSTSPATELATFYQTTPEFSSNVQQFLHNCGSAGVEGIRGYAYGESIEEIEMEDGSAKGKAVLIMIGWDSKEKHMEFRESDIFKQNIGLLLRDGKGSIEMHHTVFKKY